MSNFRTPGADVSRRDTTCRKVGYLGQLQLGAEPGRAGWVRRALRLRVAESRQDRALCARILRERHYLQSSKMRPHTLVLSVLADLQGAGPGDAGAAGLVQVAALPGNYPVLQAVGAAQYEALTLHRLWRADDLGPAVAPGLTPEFLRRVVRGERGRGPWRGLREEWLARKCREDGWRAAPRLLLTYADPGQGHDGATYLAAGAIACGLCPSGKLLFVWSLDQALSEPLKRWAAARLDRQPEGGV